METVTQNNTTEPRFVVGIGASAGGLDPIQRFFDNAPSSTNVAYIVVQHLSPDHNSLMKQLLADHTNMDIHVISDGEVIQSNHIYLIPPKTVVEVEEGRFKLYEKSENKLTLTIDIFFHSLGRCYREKVISIILSGSGTDGSRGIKTVSELGGIVMAQTPINAQFSSMPNTAIQTGKVDFVGSMAEIAQQLVSIFEHDDLRDPVRGWYTDQQSFFHIINAIKLKQGIDFSHYRRGTLERRIEKRMQMVGVYSLVDYSDYLTKEPSETQALTDEFLIGVTKFFRDTEAFEIIKKQVIPALVQKSMQQGPVPGRLRFWVAGCSSGEEAYSLAILLYDYCTKSKIPCDFKIFATDVDQRAIKKASIGQFSHEIAYDVPPEFLETYFVKSDKHYEIHKNVRGRVVFAHHNVLEDPPFIDMDFVSSRNMLIYVDQPSQETIIHQFLYSLKPTGFLFLGTSESIPRQVEDFDAVSKKWKVFQKKDTDKRYTPKIKLFRFNNDIIEGFPNIKKQPEKRSHRSSDGYSTRKDYRDLILEHYAPAFILVDSSFNIIHVSSHAGSFLNFPNRVQDFHLERAVDKEYLSTFKSGIRQALDELAPCEYREVPFSQKEKSYVLTLRFIPKQSEEKGEEIVLVEFVEESTAPKAAKAEVFTYDKHTQQKVEMLELELRETRRALEEAAHRSEATEEELQATNEELMSSNEEMQSTNEELQSVNEELYTVNAELQEKIGELSQLNNDINNLLESTDIGTIFLDHKLNIRKFTPSIREHFNVVDSDLGRSITHFRNNFGQDNFRDIANQVLKSLEAEQHEVVNESGRHFLMRINPFLTPEDGVKGVVISFIDIEKLKQAEKELQQSESKYRDLYHKTPAMMYSIDPRGTILSVSQFWLDKMGYARDEVVGKKFIKFLSEASQTQAKGTLASYFEGGVKNVPYQFINKAGDVIETLLSATTEWDEQLQKTLSLVVITDITERVAAEKALVERNHFIRNITTAIPHVVYVYDHEHQKNTYANRQLHTLLGYTQEEIQEVGNIHGIIHPEDVEDVQRKNEELMQARDEDIIEIEYRIKQADGDYLWLTSTEKVFRRNEEGKVIQAIGVAQDISARKQAKEELVGTNEELRIANQQLDRFVYAAAHDLQAPVSNLKNLMKLNDMIQLEEDRAPIQKQIANSVDRLEDTLKGLISIIDIRKDSKKEIVCIAFEEVLSVVLDQLASVIKETEASVTHHFGQAATICYIQPYLHSIMLNLVGNAIKYADASRRPEVHLSTRKNGSNIILTVEDNGIGIDLSQHYERLFQPFERISADRPGKGIGLSIIRSMIERNQGRVEVESTLGQGSTFHAYLKPY